VNSAGATKRADFFTLTEEDSDRGGLGPRRTGFEEDWQDGIARKFHGYVGTTREAWPHLRQAKGSIVNIVGIGSRADSAAFTIGGSVNVASLNLPKQWPISEYGRAFGTMRSIPV
jgi:NAD(P)-dependent dehydrogenase (short-subunit alcohol dehydrogenase family)